MFTCKMKGCWHTVTVYAVDFNHDAFLIGKDGKFKWVSMDEFVPI
jgi:hypothetical protein